MKMFYSHGNGVFMQNCHVKGSLLLPASRRWSRARVRILCPRRHLRVLPTRTRPSLFASD
ncbi:MAG: hypothetical protein ACP5FH_10500 [Terracidiphilus sp.]